MADGRWQCESVHPCAIGPTSRETQGHANYPLIGDPELHVAKAYDMLHPDAREGSRTAVDNQTVRSVLVIGPDKKVNAMIVYDRPRGLHAWIRAFSTVA